MNTKHTRGMGVTALSSTSAVITYRDHGLKRGDVVRFRRQFYRVLGHPLKDSFSIKRVGLFASIRLNLITGWAALKGYTQHARTLISTRMRVRFFTPTRNTQGTRK